MTDKDDEIVALLRELVQINKENQARYTDSVKRSEAAAERNQRSYKRTLITNVALIALFLAAVYFHAFR